ncbi:MAG: SAM-dependent methyltransferase [Acidimicrobiales bacterium]|jgi:methyltransferase (TIGR00027 family)
MAGDGPVLPAVGVTAVGVAALRAEETERPERLFADPLAAAFVRAAGPGDHPSVDARRARRRASLAAWVVVRTRFLDDLVLDACAGGCRQVVILGAGLDARAFRLAWPDELRVFEIDLPEVLEFKEQVVRAEGWRPSCERITVPADLAEDWSLPLGEQGFEAGTKVAWLAEGLLAYLSPEACDSLVVRAAELSAPGSRLGLTLASSQRLKDWQEAHPEHKGEPGDYVALWRSAGAEQAVEWLGSHGWRAEVFDIAERAASYGRPLDPDAARADGARLVDAERR